MGIEIVGKCDNCGKTATVPLQKREYVFNGGILNFPGWCIVSAPPADAAKGDFEKEQRWTACSNACEESLVKKLLHPHCFGYAKEHPERCAGEVSSCESCDESFCEKHADVNQEREDALCEKCGKEADAEEAKDAEERLQEVSANEPAILAANKQVTVATIENYMYGLGLIQEQVRQAGDRESILLLQCIAAHLPVWLHNPAAPKAAAIEYEITAEDISDYATAMKKVTTPPLLPFFTWLQRRHWQDVD